MGRKKAAAKAADENIFSFDCDGEDNGFSEDYGPVDDVVKSFSFFADSTSETKPEVCEKQKTSEKLIDNRTLQKQPYGITPPVDGERK